MTEQQTQEAAPQVYAPGTPIWIDVNAPDPAARAFYSGLFGWKVWVNDDPMYGGYGMFFQDGKQVAGVGPTMDPNQPSAWSTYLKTADADETAAKVADAGGQVVVPVMQVGPNGRMAIFTDPAGAFVGIWEPGEHKGSELFNQPVSLIWSELRSRNLEAASGFYHRVFGWDPSGGDGWAQYDIDGRPIASGTSIDSATPAVVSSHWRPYFSVQDCAETVDSARAMGATVLEEPHTEEYGTFAVLQDPQGAVFGVMSS